MVGRGPGEGCHGAHPPQLRQRYPALHGVVRAQRGARAALRARRRRVRRVATDRAPALRRRFAQLRSLRACAHPSACALIAKEQ